MRNITVYASIGETIPHTVEKIRRELSKVDRNVSEGSEIAIKIVFGKEPSSSSRCLRPPNGLIPRFIREENRRDEIVAAMNRYTTAGCRIPTEWLEEYNDLVRNGSR